MALLAQGLHAGYPDQPEVLSGVDLSMEPGRFLCLLGPNGTGKSTLLRALCGLLPLRAGRVLLDDEDVGRVAARRRAQEIGFLPQEVQPAFPFRVAEAVALGARVAGHANWFDNRPSSEARDAVQRALQMVDAEHLAERMFGDLSGGERKRVLIASVLAQEPRYLLLDEPAAMLDLHHQAELFDMLRELAGSGLGVLCVTHDCNLAASFSDELILLHAGRIEVRGSARQVLQRDALRKVFGERFELLEVAGRAPIVLPD